MVAKGVLAPVANPVDEPDVAGRPRVNDGIKHGDHGRAPDPTGQQQHRTLAPGEERELTAGRADLKFRAHLDVVMEIIGRYARRQVRLVRRRRFALYGKPVVASVLGAVGNSVIADHGRNAVR